jgi:hypothetical protein
MTQDELNARARALGITPEAAPWAWKCAWCDYDAMSCICCDNGADWQCILPPDSPAWVGWYMEALGWPVVQQNLYSMKWRIVGFSDTHYATPLEALRAAWEARG